MLLVSTFDSDRFCDSVALVNVEDTGNGGVLVSLVLNSIVDDLCNRETDGNSESVRSRKIEIV